MIVKAFRACAEASRAFSRLGPASTFPFRIHSAFDVDDGGFPRMSAVLDGL
jgi:hypothetical protein